jgi:oligopeptide transport system permease protein
MSVATADIKSVAKSRQRSAAQAAWIRFRRNKLAMIAGIFIIVEILVAIAAPLLAPYGPYVADYANAWKTPGGVHVLGTDDMGRDLLSRLLYGARVSLAVGIVSQIVNLAIGLPLGALAGMMGGWVDFVLLRIIDVLSAVPMMLLYILLMIALGMGLQNIIIAMAITGWIGYARLVRGQVLSLKQTDYVRAARAMGGDTKHIVLTHLVRNSLTPVIVSLAMGVPGAMFAEAGLSYMGLGIRPPEPSWGQSIGTYQGYIQTLWHLTVFPAILLALTMLAWMYLGDGLRDALDPTMRV